MPGKGTDDECVFTWHGTRLQDRVRVGQIVGKIGSLFRSVRINRPETLNDKRVFIDVFPAAEEDPPVWKDRRIEFRFPVDGDRVDVRAVRVHDVQDRDAGIKARDKPAVSGRSENDPSVRQPGRCKIMVSGIVPFIRIAVVIQIRQLRQTCPVHIDLIDDGVSVRRALVREKDRFCVVRQFRVRIVPVSQRRRRRGIDDRSDSVFFRRISGILKNIDAAGSRIFDRPPASVLPPMIERVVNVRRLVIVPCREKDRECQTFL